MYLRKKKKRDIPSTGSLSKWPAMAGAECDAEPGPGPGPGTSIQISHTGGRNPSLWSQHLLPSRVHIGRKLESEARD